MVLTLDANGEQFYLGQLLSIQYPTKQQQQFVFFVQRWSQSHDCEFFTFLSHFALRLFTIWNISGCSKTPRMYIYSRPNSSSTECMGIYFFSSELCQFLSIIKCIFILFDLIRCFLPVSHFSLYSPLFLSVFTISHPVTIYHCIYKSFM